jgi:intraflagellar transport protein 52
MYSSLISNKDEISRDRLSETNLIVFGCPREPFSAAEFNEMKSWLNSGGRVLVMLGDGGEKQNGSNMNYLLEESVFFFNSLFFKSDDDDLALGME